MRTPTWEVTKLQTTAKVHKKHRVELFVSVNYEAKVQQKVLRHAALVRPGSQVSMALPVQQAVHQTVTNVIEVSVFLALDMCEGRLSLAEFSLVQSPRARKLFCVVVLFCSMSCSNRPCWLRRCQLILW